MSAAQHASTEATQPGRRKPGGKLSGNRSHQGTKSPSSGSAAHIGVRPTRQYQCTQAEAGSIRISEVLHTWVCSQHGFYTKNFSLAERRGLQATEGVVLGDEIGLLRVLIRRSS
ncbi:MAG: hypothetical protein K0B14_18485 [Anaerolineaceae bacterium]|nr:hypothetical protein [Anaerolineaceae bacterium]